MFQGHWLSSGIHQFWHGQNEETSSKKIEPEHQNYIDSAWHGNAKRTDWFIEIDCLAESESVNQGSNSSWEATSTSRRAWRWLQQPVTSWSCWWGWYMFMSCHIYIYVCVYNYTLYINENPSGSEGGNAIKDQDRLISLRLCKLCMGFGIVDCQSAKLLRVFLCVLLLACNSRSFQLSATRLSPCCRPPRSLVTPLD